MPLIRLGIGLSQVPSTTTTVSGHQVAVWLIRGLANLSSSARLEVNASRVSRKGLPSVECRETSLEPWSLCPLFRLVLSVLSDWRRYGSARDAEQTLLAAICLPESPLSGWRRSCTRQTGGTDATDQGRDGPTSGRAAQLEVADLRRIAADAIGRSECSLIGSRHSTPDAGVDCRLIPFPARFACSLRLAGAQKRAAWRFGPGANSAAPSSLVSSFGPRPSRWLGEGADFCHTSRERATQARARRLLIGRSAGGRGQLGIYWISLRTLASSLSSLATINSARHSNSNHRTTQ